MNFNRDKSNQAFTFKRFLTTAAAVFSLTCLAHADQSKILDVVISKTSPESFKISVTLIHNDTGWDHYADEWQVVDHNGNILAQRVLAHPHVNEQPFTRSLSNVAIQTDINQVFIRAKDNNKIWSENAGPFTVPH